MLACASFLMLGSLDPGFIQRVFQQKPQSTAYQSLSKVKEGLTQDAERITETIRSCDRDED
jgi:hypothetical protein